MMEEETPATPRWMMGNQQNVPQPAPAPYSQQTPAPAPIPAPVPQPEYAAPTYAAPSAPSATPAWLSSSTNDSSDDDFF